MKSRSQTLSAGHYVTVLDAIALAAHGPTPTARAKDVHLATVSGGAAQIWRVVSGSYRRQTSGNEYLSDAGRRVGCAMTQPRRDTVDVFRSVSRLYARGSGGILLGKLRSGESAVCFPDMIA